MSKISVILRNAALIIENVGLSHGDYEGKDGSVDIVEAIFRAATGMSQADYYACRNRGTMPITLDQHNKFRFSVITLRNYLKDNDEIDQPAIWGDSQDAKEVIYVLRACADHEEGLTVH